MDKLELIKEFLNFNDQFTKYLSDWNSSKHLLEHIFSKFNKKQVSLEETITKLRFFLKKILLNNSSIALIFKIANDKCNLEEGLIFLTQLSPIFVLHHPHLLDYLLSHTCHLYFISEKIQEIEFKQFNKIISILLKEGANPSALMSLTGGDFNSLQLICLKAEPHLEIIKLLIDTKYDFFNNNFSKSSSKEYFFGDGIKMLTWALLHGVDFGINQLTLTDQNEMFNQLIKICKEVDKVNEVTEFIKNEIQLSIKKSAVSALMGIKKIESDKKQKLSKYLKISIFKDAYLYQSDDTKEIILQWLLLPNRVANKIIERTIEKFTLKLEVANNKASSCHIF
ncbi:MAG: hypothetical protein HYX60_12035 [Legionella longbeachae]|nr:hypothetical protein [Legionella longbeachae]